MTTHNAHLVALKALLEGELPHVALEEAQKHLTVIFEEHRHLVHHYTELQEAHEEVLGQLYLLREQSFAAVGRRHRDPDYDGDEAIACPF